MNQSLQTIAASLGGSRLSDAASWITGTTMVIDATREWIGEEVGAGALRPLRTALFYAVLIGPCQEFARQWVRRRDREALEEAVVELGEAAWRAVRA